jgi:hypothetical protein
MKHQFSEVPRADIPRSSFDRSHGYKTTLNAGFLVPIFVDEALPGDTFNLSMTGFARLATPIFPVMDNIFMETFFFAVPHRLLWENWEKFCGSQDNPGDSTDFTIPQVTVTPSKSSPVPGPTENVNVMAGYFGLPYGSAMSVSALPFRAMNLIFNDWFRDENLSSSTTVAVDDGPDNPGDYLMQRRGKRYDYFTSCLPFPQKGESVDLPLGTVAPVIANVGTGPTFQALVGAEDFGQLEGNLDASATWENASTSQNLDTAVWNDPDLIADLSGATAATINQLRQAFQVQKLLERDARGGTRYTEVIKAHFGVTSPDARLQRPEYLGGGRSPVNISPVPQTSSTDAETPQGNLAAFGTSSLFNHGFTKSFTEHCVLIGLVNVRADLNYQQGIDRMWSRETRFDYYWPALAHIGEQAVLNKEIFYQNNVNDDDVFGYQERFAEYRYKQSRITDIFNSSVAGSLDSWHLAQEFSGLPVLGSTFIRETPPMSRIKAVVTEPDFLFDSYFRMRCARPMPLYGVPGFVDHF